MGTSRPEKNDEVRCWKEDFGGLLAGFSVVEMKRAEDPGAGVFGSGKPWSLHSGVQGEAKDRRLGPPALPVPIASFTV